MKLTKKQSLWLTNKGGRTVDDVLSDRRGLYVLMHDEDGILNIKVYIPDDKEMRIAQHDTDHPYVEMI